MSKLKFGLLIGIVSALGFFVFSGYEWNPYVDDVCVEEIPVREPAMKFGYDTQTYHFESQKIKPNEFISTILTSKEVAYPIIHRLAAKSKEVFSVRKFRSGKSLTFIREDSCATPIAFVYEPDNMNYVIYSLVDSLPIHKVERAVTSRFEKKQGVIESSLWDAMVADNISLDVIDLMEDALGGTIDFYHIQKGDKFKLIYEQLYVDDKRVGLGKLKGAVFNNAFGDHFAVYYEGKKYNGFFNQDGIPNKRSFLKSPVRASRISSRFNRRRRHPVLKRIRPHLGTDYAAPYGTPIRAVASGVVTKRSRSRGNGNYVKLKHDKTYSTQYLHMQRFAKGVTRGTSVAQGDIIGYVGSTGLATGPHVCFRFWKNGRQVNHLRENFPTPDPIDKSELDNFFIVRDSVMTELSTFGDLVIESERTEDKKVL